MSIILTLLDMEMQQEWTVLRGFSYLYAMFYKGDRTVKKEMRTKVNSTHMVCLG